MRWTVFAPLASLASLGAVCMAAACGTYEPIPSGVVRFQLDAPLCSSILAVRFLIDSNVWAIDTLTINVAGRTHTTHDFNVSAGPHIARAELFSPYLNDWRRVDGWDDKSLNVVAGQTVTDTLPFYCS